MAAKFAAVRAVDMSKVRFPVEALVATGEMLVIVLPTLILSVLLKSVIVSNPLISESVKVV